MFAQNDGSKRTIRSVLRQMKRMGYDVDEIWREIRIVVVKTLIAISPELKVEYEAEIPSYRQGLTCFQVDHRERKYNRPFKKKLLEQNVVWNEQNNLNQM